VDDLEMEDMLADVASTAPAAAPAVPPEARSHLASVLGSYADDSNTCADTVELSGALGTFSLRKSACIALVVQLRRQLVCAACRYT